MNEMVSQARVSIIRHGAAVIFIGLLAGFAWTFALLEEVRISPIPLTVMEGFPGDPARWRIVHLGCILNGIMAICFGMAMGLFTMTPRQITGIKIATILIVWGNMVFYAASVFAPNRGLSFGDNAAGSGNMAGNIAYLGAFIAAFAALYVVASFLYFPRKKNDMKEDRK